MVNEFITKLNFGKSMRWGSRTDSFIRPIRGLSIVLGDDVIEGNQGKDYIEGGDGNDAIEGNQGKDSLFGGSGDDTISGDEGSDFLHGGAGDDLIDGGQGQDIAAFSGDINDYTITQNADGSYNVQDNVAGRDGTDTVYNVENLDFGGSSHVLIDFEIPAASSSDWTEAIAVDGNFDAVDSSSWLDDAVIDVQDQDDGLEFEVDPVVDDAPIVLS